MDWESALLYGYIYRHVCAIFVCSVCAVYRKCESCVCRKTVYVCKMCMSVPGVCFIVYFCVFSVSPGASEKVWAVNGRPDGMEGG